MSRKSYPAGTFRQPIKAGDIIFIDEKAVLTIAAALSNVKSVPGSIRRTRLIVWRMDPVLKLIGIDSRHLYSSIKTTNLPAATLICIFPSFHRHAKPESDLAEQITQFCMN
jgi:hypothetical protein